MKFIQSPPYFVTKISPTLLSISPNYNDTEVPNTNNYITMTFNRDVYVNLEKIW